MKWQHIYVYVHYVQFQELNFVNYIKSIPTQDGLHLLLAILNHVRLSKDSVGAEKFDPACSQFASTRDYCPYTF